MKFGFKKWTALVLMATLVSAMIAVPTFGAIPKSYWKVQQPFVTAKDKGDSVNVIKYGEEIVKIFESAPMDKDKAAILYNTHEALYKAYEKTGNYNKAIASLKALIPFGETMGFADGVKMAKARIMKINPMAQVYAQTLKTEGLPYYGMKHEPKSGTYYGRVYGKTGAEPTAEETAVSFYVECLAEDIASYDQVIRPYADGKRLIHIAFNMPSENASLQQVMQPSSDAYLKETMEYLKTLDGPVLLRIGGEMNVWENLADPALFKQAYIKIANMARQIAPNVALVFSPNDISNWNTDISAYYPGDTYVDWVGVSLYTNQFRSGQTLAVGKDHDEMYYGNGVYANPLTKLKDIVDRYGNKKPIIITECGMGSGVQGKSTDLNGFAKEKIQMFYSYVNMLYPQVKAVIYFDVDLDQPGKYEYSLTKNPQMMAKYQETTKNNVAFIKEMGVASKAYVKAGEYKDTLPTLALSTYCVLPVNLPVTVEYFLDGKKLPSDGQMPYQCNIETGSVSVGVHELKVDMRASNGFAQTKTYGMNKQADGLVTLKQK